MKPDTIIIDTTHEFLYWLLKGNKINVTDFVRLKQEHLLYTTTEKYTKKDNEQATTDSSQGIQEAGNITDTNGQQ